MSDPRKAFCHMEIGAPVGKSCDQCHKNLMAGVCPGKKRGRIHRSRCALKGAYSRLAEMSEELGEAVVSVAEEQEHIVAGVEGVRHAGIAGLIVEVADDDAGSVRGLRRGRWRRGWCR